MPSCFHTEDLSIEKNDAQFDSAAAAPLVQAEGRVNGGPQPTGNALVQKALVLYGSLTSASTEETALDVCDEFEVDEVEGSDVVALTEEEVQQAKDSLPEGTEHWIDTIVLFIPRLFLDIPAEDLHLAVALLKHGHEFSKSERVFCSALMNNDLPACEDEVKRQWAVMRRVLATLYVRQPRGSVGRWACRFAVDDMPSDLAMNELAVEALGLKLDLERILDRAGIERPVAPVVQRRWWQREPARISGTGSEA